MSPFLDYNLPAHLIAQQPATRRDQSRLLVARRNSRTLAHHVFADLPDLLNPGDLLVLNNTRVLPARLVGRRERTEGRWEGLFLGARADGAGEFLCQTGGKPVAGEMFATESGLRLELMERSPEGRWILRPVDPIGWTELLQRYGQVPLPPYIRKGLEGPGDRERYQTVYADEAGAVAAPTAGLHFTPEVFERLTQRNIRRAFVTLHVGPGTFQPIQVDDFTRHQMHAERGEVRQETVEAIRACKARGGRVVAVGTTTVRVLETAAAAGTLDAWAGATELFIHPPYQFRAVDGLLTNFHLPRSTLLLLVGAFAGVDLLRRAYETAIEQSYRFYSYGDAMLVL